MPAVLLMWLQFLVDPNVPFFWQAMTGFGVMVVYLLDKLLEAHFCAFLAPRHQRVGRSDRWLLLVTGGFTLMLLVQLPAEAWVRVRGLVLFGGVYLFWGLGGKGRRLPLREFWGGLVFALLLLPFHTSLRSEGGVFLLGLGWSHFLLTHLQDRSRDLNNHLGSLAVHFPKYAQWLVVFLGGVATWEAHRLGISPVLMLLALLHALWPVTLITIDYSLLLSLGVWFLLP
jgi:hypothetical protein